MPKLNQVVAVVSGKKSRAQRLLTDAHRGWAPDAIAGVSRTYTPKDEEGERFPPEHKRIHVDVAAKVAETLFQVADFWDVVATQEWGNTQTGADVAIDGLVLVQNAPIAVLLFMEKQLTDLHTFVSQLPILPPDRSWGWDANRGCYATEPTETLKTQKVPAVLVKYEATKDHPAQTEAYTKDVVVGTYTTTYLCSGYPAEAAKMALARIEKLQDAVKAARENANSVEVQNKSLAYAVFDYALAGLTERVQS